VLLQDHADIIHPAGLVLSLTMGHEMCSFMGCNTDQIYVEHKVVTDHQVISVTDDISMKCEQLIT
jgi:hypothetical protein